jgi:hypothetical protein
MRRVQSSVSPKYLRSTCRAKWPLRSQSLFLARIAVHPKILFAVNLVQWQRMEQRYPFEPHNQALYETTALLPINREKSNRVESTITDRM